MIGWKSVHAGITLTRVPAACPIGRRTAVIRGHSRGQRRAHDLQDSSSAALYPEPSKLVIPSSSPLDGLGRVRRVKAKPADADRFASLDTAATAKGRQLRGGRGEEYGTN
jgi:hypothetical protein